MTGGRGPWRAPHGKKPSEWVVEIDGQEPKTVEAVDPSGALALVTDEHTVNWRRSNDGSYAVVDRRTREHIGRVRPV